VDPLTHALSGALLTRATAPHLLHPKASSLPLHLRVTAGFTAAAFPDIDLVLRLIDTLTYLNWHQGPTHSLIMLPLWSLLLSHLFSQLTHKHYSWKVFYFPVCLGIAIHIAGDLITSYGLMLFAPLSAQRFSLPLVFVIDPWFSLIIIMGLVLSAKFPHLKSIAICALIGLACYVGFLWHLHTRAYDIGISHAKLLNTVAQTNIDVLPQPLSPFNWKIIIQHRDTYHTAYVNLRPYHNTAVPKTDTWLIPEMAAAYQPSADIKWQRWEKFGKNQDETGRVQLAWSQPEFEQFRQFSVLPRLDRIEQSKNSTCFWFFDLRFQFPELPPSFRYGICQAGNHSNNQSHWHIQRKQGIFLID